MIQLVVAVALAVLLSAMCSLFEAVLYSVPVSHIEKLAHRGRASGRILKELRRHVDRPISAILSLNTIANTAGAAVAGASAASVFGREALPYFSAVFTLAILIFSEVVPKTAGVVYSRPLAVPIARPLQALVWVFAPLVWLCRGVTRLIQRRRVDHDISEEELIVMARLGLQAGTIEADELEVIENILELERTRARRVMTPRSVMVALDHALSVDEARLETGVLTHSRIPVFDGTPDNVIGIVHRRDILTAVADGKGATTVGQLMQAVHFVPDSITLDRALRLFLERRQHLMVVVDEHGGVAGILTLEDVLEEILGREIVDEFDETADLRETARRRREKILRDRKRRSGDERER
jgi:CBS domain containing-hemolysin-like protein